MRRETIESMDFEAEIQKLKDAMVVGAQMQLREERRRQEIAKDLDAMTVILRKTANTQRETEKKLSALAPMIDSLERGRNGH